MKKSEWSDRELEELFMQMPKIKDHRNPRDIYQNLSLKRRKTKTWLLPSLATAAALLLFFILVPKLMDGANSSSDKQAKITSFNKETKDADQKKNSTFALNKGESSSNEKALSGTPKNEVMATSTVKTAIYASDVGNGKVLTYWIPDPQGQILIPVSTVVAKSDNESWLTLYNENMANLKEEEWGLTDFYPLNVTMSVNSDNTTIQVDVPINHQYGHGSTNETSFINVLNKDISSNSDIKKVKFSTNGEPGIELGNFGNKQEIDINLEKNHGFFFYYPTGSDVPFLTPSTTTYSDINKALDAMKTDQTELGLTGSLSPLLPVSDVSIADKTLVLSFKGNTTLQDNQMTVSAFEALLLTAKEFGLEKVVVKDSPILQLGPFDLTKENQVPVAPNLRSIQ
ncbi:negative regulator of sigma-X activity [Neobacillus drentensis]|uniref:negative regulator of sigma-X activity n=1 Tax=Neobacillus drentensis TaxID=220684 RepID=UPI003000CAFC